MWLARPNALSTSGWRWNKGDKVNFAVIAKQNTGSAQTNSQWVVTLAEATATMSSLAVAATCLFAMSF